MNDIRGKQVLITGAARGIGYAFARAFVDEGASVMIADRDIERAETAAQSLGERCAAVLMDLFFGTFTAMLLPQQLIL